MKTKFDEDLESIYISGSISGRDEDVATDHFKTVQNAIEQDSDIYVYNPTEFKKRDCWEDYMRDSLAALVDSDAILMLNGWQQSRGAVLERNVAFQLDIPIYYEYTTPWDSSGN